MAKRDETEDEVARLYGLPLDEFVAERDATAKRLRSAGDRDGAARVKALRKPTVPAAAINRAVRADPEAVEALVAAGQRLERAQENALSAGDAAPLRDASSEHSEAVERLMAAVESELGGAGGSAAVDRARETLRAAAGDEDLRAELAAGTLVRDREGIGFGGVGLPAGAPKRRTKPRASTRKAKGAAAKRQEAAKKRPANGPSAAERKRAEQAVRRAERSLDGAAKRLKDAERRLERARRALADAEDERADALREHSERETALAEARDSTPE